ncbi:hypothetical protein LLEC1_01729 [Akanthomyces lecanii]|uniref:Protein SQS1 n=1 Tax=Cordyceps confragosa TaxID=2714763 RepID=A0A179IVL2_CORDF|nr:hypothetical protein LLEC1_01729 [Akanthomyces lecanii]
MSFAGTNNAFTLADEARQTGQHDHSFWNQETKLRSMPISFTSGGISEPLKTHEDAEMDEHQPNTDTPSQHDASEIEGETAGHRSADTRHDERARKIAASTSQASETENSVFYYDTGRGSPNTHQEKGKASIPQTAKERVAESKKGESDIDSDIDIDVDSDIDSDSDSDSEVILFRGRLNLRREASDAIDMQNIRTEIYAVGREIEDPVQEAVGEKPPEKRAKQKTARGRRGGRQTKAKRAAGDVLDEGDDGMLADYITNMRENGEIHELLGTATAPEDTEDGSESSTDSKDDKNAEKSTEAPIATHSSKQLSNWATQAHVMKYSDFDPMDWERPSLRHRQGKGAKQKLDLKFADIDSETERNLQAAWQNDRLRKAERRKERDQLHALKLIGGNSAGKSHGNDMHIKYPKGMSLEQVADELKTFITSFDNRYGFMRFDRTWQVLTQSHSVCLPPMDKHARKMIHELASKFNVKSKSIGKADQRRPTLYRTKRTLRFDADAFESAVKRIHRRYIPRLDYKGKSSQGESSRNGYAEASYRDGEIVGASAPELSTENRGRAMLEKMGWSTGTALGSEDNKGILLPVTQTMKRSKAGLG